MTVILFKTFFSRKENILFIMKNFYQLNKKLKKLDAQKTNFDSIEQMSIFRFLKHKKIVLQRAKVKEQIRQTIITANNAISGYNSYNDSLIKSNKINCRKYVKLQKKAEYKRNFTLYKLGLISKKPSPPFLQNLKLQFSKINLPLFTYFKNIKSKYSKFESSFLSPKVNRLAVSTAKLGIRGYRKFKSDYVFIRKHINESNWVQYLKDVVEQAKEQIENDKFHKTTSNGGFDTESQKYRESIQVSTVPVHFDKRQQRDASSKSIPNTSVINVSNRLELL